MENKSSFFTNRIEKIKSTWNMATPYQKWRHFYNFGLFVEDIIQMRVLSKKPFGLLGYCPCVTGIMHYSLLVYTVYYYVNRGNVAGYLPSFCVLGFITSSYAAYWTGLSKLRFEWYRMAKISGKLIYRDDNQATAYNQVCSQSIYQSIRKYIITMTLLILASFGAVLGPFYNFIHEGSYVTLYSLKLPYFNQDPHTEFLINIAWETFISILGIGGIFLIEVVTALCNDTIFVSSKLSELELNELTTILEENGKSKAKQLTQFKMILMRVSHMDEFMKSFRNIMYMRNFTAPPTFTFSIAVSIYCQYMMGYPAGYGLAVVSYVQMIMLCYSGQNIEDRNGRQLDAFYNFKWYLLPKEKQRDVIHIINRMQNGVSVTIGPFEVLNYETLKTLSQKVYSFLMFLVNLGISTDV